MSLSPHRFLPSKCELSPREREVLPLVATMPLKHAAPKLGMKYKTADKHKENIMRKLNLHSQMDLTLYAVREGFVRP
jgi:DNA-binding NarL/FixJ family response regulator